MARIANWIAAGAVCLSAASVIHARTVAFWPLGCDSSKRPDGRCRISSGNDLAITDVDKYCELAVPGRYALSSPGGRYAEDFAIGRGKDVGRFFAPTNDYTLEGWFWFPRVPSAKGEVWMLASGFRRTTSRWFLSLRRDCNNHPGLTWQFFSGCPRTTNDVLLSTVENPDALAEKWHHFALTFAHRTAAGEAEWRFWIDGRPAGRCAVAAANWVEDAGGNFALGGRSVYCESIAGSLSDCRLSDCVLEPAEFLLAKDRAHRGKPKWKPLPRKYPLVPDVPTGGRTLHNGIVLPEKWPPPVDQNNHDPVSPPYLDEANIPKVVPIDLGRQLFVDDFLVQSTSGVVRVFFKPVKYSGNPVMWPETDDELGCEARKATPARRVLPPGCCMSGGGVWWDAKRKSFRMWYMSGWSGPLSLAESADGLHWTRPPVGKDGTNLVLPDQICDTFSVWPGYDTDAPYDNWRISISPGGNPTRSAEYVSKDGIHWEFLAKTGLHFDCTTLFYDPFIGKWVWSLRAVWRDRSRIYHAHRDFRSGAEWHFPLGRGIDGRKDTVDCSVWLACDNADIQGPPGHDGTVPQLYNVDAVPYESIMVGLFKILCGHDNNEAAKAGLPKTTSVHFAYSRDGFHFSRPDRTPAIAASGWGGGAWDAGYLGPISSCFVINDDQLWFYYVSARGDASRNFPPTCALLNGMHWNFSVGIAKLRRDGFAGMSADGTGELTTRPVKFSGSHFFMNADAHTGSVAVEVLDDGGRPFSGYSAADCVPLLRANSTKYGVSWKGGDLSRFAGRPVRFRFKMRTSTLFSFWVSAKHTGESGGYVAAGGPAYGGLRDE